MAFNAFHEFAVTLAKVHRQELPFAVGLPSVSGPQRLPEGRFFVLLPAPPVPGTIPTRTCHSSFCFINCTYPVLTAPKPIIDDPNLPGILWHPHRLIPATSIASRAGGCTPCSVGPDS